MSIVQTLLTGKTPYAPKYCRTRRCALLFGHKDNCDVPQRVAVPFKGKTPTAHGVSVYYRPSRSPRMRHGTDPAPRRSQVERATRTYNALGRQIAIERLMVRPDSADAFVPVQGVRSIELVGN